MKQDKELPEVEETMPADAWSTVEQRATGHAEWLSEAVAEYLAKGGKVTEVAEGVSGYDGGITQ